MLYSRIRANFITKHRSSDQSVATGARGPSNISAAEPRPAASTLPVSVRKRDAYAVAAGVERHPARSVALMPYSDITSKCQLDTALDHVTSYQDASRGEGVSCVSNRDVSVWGAS